MLFLTGTIIAFFLSALLFGKKGNNQADRILAFWLFFTGIHLSLFHLLITEIYSSLPHLLGLELALPLLHGPFLYLYVSALTRIKPLRYPILWHFIPYFLANAFLIPFYLLSAQQKVVVYNHQGLGYEVLTFSLYASILISGLGYSILALNKLRKHQKTIGVYFSYTEKINLSWLRYLIFGSALIWLIVLFGSDFMVYITITLYVLFIGYFGIKQVGIFSNPIIQIQYLKKEEEVIDEPETILEELSEAKPKYEKSSLTAVQIQKLYQQLGDLMLNEKLFTNPELSLSELAAKLSVHSNILSQVINTRESKNFFDYINTLRVEEFKKLALSPEHQKFTLLALAFDVGFNSKTSFNRNFKKVTGLSPSEYLKHSNIQLS